MSTPISRQQYETRSKRTGQRMFVVRCCNWSTSSIVHEEAAQRLQEHDSDYGHQESKS